MQTGWFKEVRVKDLDSHSVRALLASRALLVKIKRDLENQIRGLLKNVGLVIGRAKFNVFAVRAEELIENRPELIAVVGPLLKARQAIEQQTDDLDRKVLKLARHDAQVRRFMTVPGIGPITALCFKATVDDPTRFKLTADLQANLPALIDYGPVNLKAFETGKISEADAKASNSSPENIKVQALLRSDWWGKNLATVQPMWDAFVQE